jgi:hypothetical protein
LGKLPDYEITQLRILAEVLMFEKILQFFRVMCAHRHTSQPFSEAAAVSGPPDWDHVGSTATHYIVCLDCGRKFNYDWDNMRVIR